MAIPWAGQLQRVAVWQATYPAAYQLELASLQFTWFTSLCFVLLGFGLFRFALVWFGWLIAGGRITFAGEKTTMGIWYSGFGIGNSQLATGNWQLAAALGVFIFTDIV